MTPLGHDAQIDAFLAARAAARLHHAWLLTGPQGVGKGTFARAAALRLLADAAGPASAAGGLDVPDDHRIAHLWRAGSHPDAMTLERAYREKSKDHARSISVDQVRSLSRLFATAPSFSPVRTVIVDAAEDMERAGANALLKMLEEPPADMVFLLVSHAPQRLLPTIRSRCRRLTLRPLAEPDLTAVIAGLGPPWGETEAAALARASARAEGSVGRALELLDPAASALVDEVETLVEGLWRAPQRLDGRRVLALAERLAPREADALFALCLDTVQGLVSRALGARAGEPVARLAGLVAVCDKVAAASREAATYNLDRRPLVLSLFGDLAEATR